MNNKKNISPPRFADRFLEFYCREEYLEEIRGDVYELFEVRQRNLSPTKARRLFVWDVLRFFRWSNLKRNKRINSNNFIMIRNYFTIARRGLVREKGYSMLNLIGLYIGFVCLILTVVYLNSEFSYDKHHTNVESTYRLLDVSGTSGIRGNQTAAPWAPALQEQFPEVLTYARSITHGAPVFEYDGERYYEQGGLYIDGEALNMFSLNFIHGNPETALDEPNQLIMSETLATKYFGDENPIGKLLRVNNAQTYTVTGVFADKQERSHLQFNYAASFDSHNAWFKTDWGMENYITYLQLSEGADVPALEAKMTQFFKERHTEPDQEYNNRAELQPVSDIYLRDDSNGQNPRMSKVLLVGVIGSFILFVALVNYVNMVTARSGKRLKEVGVRKSIGAQKGQLVQQFLIENFIVCFMVFVLAIVSFKAFLPGFSELVGTELSFSIQENYMLVLLVFGITVLISLICGFYPAMILSALKPANLVKNTSGVLGGKQYLRKTLTTIQFVISMALIIATALVYKQLQFLLDKDLGFDKEEVLVVSVSNSSLRNNLNVFADQVRNIPGVREVATSANSMGGGDWGMPFRYEVGKDPLSIRFMSVNADYGDVMGLEMLEGRFFSEELQTDQQNTYIVNESFLKAVGWDTGLDKRIDMPSRDRNNPWTPGKIIGVVKDFNFRSLHTQVSPMVIANREEWNNILFIKLNAGQSEGVISSVQEAWDAANTGFPFAYYFLDYQIDRFYEAEKRMSSIATIFGVIAIALACIGLFSLSTYMAEQKMKEVSIRKVMGASLNQIGFLFSKQFLLIILISTFIAVPLSLYYLDEWLNTYAFGINIWQSLEIPAMAALGTVAVALLTIAIQTFRLAKSNPIKFLRSE